LQRGALAINLTVEVLIVSYNWVNLLEGSKLNFLPSEGEGGEDHEGGRGQVDDGNILEGPGELGVRSERARVIQHILMGTSGKIQAIKGESSLLKVLRVKRPALHNGSIQREGEERGREESQSNRRKE